MKKQHKNLKELITTLSPYLNQSALARICEINEGQMRQYVSDVRNPSQQTIDKINKGINRFADDLKGVQIE